MFLQEAFHIHGGHTSLACGHDGLAVVGVAHVAGSEDSGHVGGARGVLHLDVALLVERYLPTEEVGVGLVADGDEHTGQLHLPFGTRLGVLQLDAGHTVEVGAEYLADAAVPAHFYLGVGEHAVLHGLRGAQLVAAVHEVHLAAEGAEVVGFYGDWVSALRTECDANGLELSTATAEWTAKKVSPETFALFDFVTVMAYADDSSTVSHTTLEFGQKQMNYIAQEKQVPPEKLVLGIPFYGRGYTADGQLDRSYYKSFAQLIAADPANYDRDVYEGVAYNGAPTVRVKCNYAKNYGGVMIWQLAQDAEGEYSLLAVIKDEMCPKAGDLNADGVCDAVDVALFSDWLLCKTENTPVRLTAGDMDADGILNAKDLTLLLRCAAAASVS